MPLAAGARVSRETAFSLEGRKLPSLPAERALGYTQISFSLHQPAVQLALVARAFAHDLQDAVNANAPANAPSNAGIR